MTTQLHNADNQNVFISDLALAASLLSKDVRLVNLDKTEPRKVKFAFKRTAVAEKIIDQFWNDQLLLNPRTYFDNIKLLKNRIYGG
jgi:hypothetical protein